VINLKWSVWWKISFSSTRIFTEWVLESNVGFCSFVGGFSGLPIFLYKTWVSGVACIFLIKTFRSI
jgi:hypothetical protein